MRAASTPPSAASLLYNSAGEVTQLECGREWCTTLSELFSVYKCGLEYSSVYKCGLEYFSVYKCGLEYFSVYKCGLEYFSVIQALCCQTSPPATLGDRTQPGGAAVFQLLDRSGVRTEVGVRTSSGKQDNFDMKT